LGLLYSHVDCPVVAWSHGTGKRVTGDFGWKNRTKAVVEQANSTLRLVNRGNAELGKSVHDG
jgi:hypothetical protein